jgi:hypothetical protein
MTTATKNAPDISVSNHGTIFLFQPLTEAAKEWINLHVPSDATYFAGSLCVEHRYAYDLAEGMANDGLTLE